MKRIDELLNNITMYRLVVYVLGGYAALAVVFALIGKLSLSPTNMIISLAVLLLAAYVADRGFSRLWDAPSNTESWLITSLILFLILKPGDDLASWLVLALAGAISSVSKFIIAWQGKHIFNPAALAAAFLSLTSLGTTSWWIGSSIFWPVTFVFGLAIVRKVRRLPLLLAFTSSSIVLQVVVFVARNQPIGIGLKAALISSPLIFLATIMLTEPATMPPRRNEQLLFGLIVAALYVMAWKLGPFYVYPEVALLLGNVYAFVVSPKFRVRLKLKEIRQISDQVYHYVFQPERRFAFISGQYMEWTLPHVPYDSRGNRRSFTIASSPTEDTVQLGLKYYQPSSAFKAAFFRLKPGDSVYASQLAGDFTLAKDPSQKLVFIAGGIGITPFRSMVQYVVDTNQQRDMTLLYMAGKREEFAFRDEFQAAAAHGLKTQYILGLLPDDKFATFIPLLEDSLIYISGPDGFVTSYKKRLLAAGISRTQIRTDHFTGY